MMRRTLIKNKKSYGFTIIELMLAMLMIGIVFSAASVIMAFGQKSLDREWEQTTIQRDAARTMQVIKQNIRGASIAKVTDNGAAVKVYKDGKWIKIKYYKNEKTIRYASQAEEFVDNGEDTVTEEERPLIEGIVESASFSLDEASNSTVDVDFSLKNGQFKASAKSSVTMRNSAAKI